MPSWYNSVLPPLVTLSKRNNRISPSDSPTFSHLLKRLTPNPIPESIIQQHIYMKSPYIVASGELAGSIVIEQGDTSIMQSLELSLIGVEVVVDSCKSNIKTFEFLNTSILNVSNLEQYKTMTNKIMVPFLVSLPSELGGTYIDKKGSIQYCLYSTLSKKSPSSSEPIITKRPVIVYSNMVLKSLKDASTLYTPVLQSNKQVWKNILIDLTMPRTVWMSGAPIYVTVKVNNATLRDTVMDMKLELVRKQNTYSMDKDQSIIPVTSSCDTIAHSSLANLGWWKPLEPNSKDHVILTIEAPANQVTVQNQKLIHVSYFIRMSISSNTSSSTEVVTELPVMLVHPISMDPPPGNYTKSVTKPIANDYHLLQDTFHKQQQAAKILQSSASFTSLDSTSCKSYSSSIQSSTSLQPQPTIKRLESVRKSLSTWGSRITRKISVSSGINHQLYRQKLEISSPIMPSSLESFNDSIESTIPSIKDDEQDIHNFIASDNSVERMSVLKFGQIKGPKRFGQQPGCLGDAGLDIRNCFNVATATEAMQSYAAEKVELADDDEWFMDKSYPPCQKLKWNDGNCKTIQPSESVDIQEETDATEMASCLNIHQNKRMLASSRHLRNVQRKSAQVCKDGRPLLALTNLA